MRITSKIMMAIIAILMMSIQLSGQENETIKQENSQYKIDENQLFGPVEEMPRFPACEDQDLSKKDLEKCAKDALISYVYDKLEYPSEAKKNGIEGMVIIQFKINEKGQMQDLKIARDIGYECGKAALKIFEQMKKEVTWIAGKQRWKPVTVQYTMPVKFKL